MLALWTLTSMVVFELYYHKLVMHRQSLLVMGQRRDDWLKLARLITQLSPWLGVVRFMAPQFLALLFQETGVLIVPLWGWLLTIVLGLISSYRSLLPYFYQYFKTYTSSSKPHGIWLRKVVRSHFMFTLAREYPVTNAFYRLAWRFFYCRHFGHPWTEWDHVKYIASAASRTCRKCLVSETQERDAHTFHETHATQWKPILNPDSVFFRKRPAPQSKGE